MKENILIVEDEFVVAYDLQMILEKQGYTIAGIAASVSQALAIIEKTDIQLVLLDIYLKGKLNGIDLAKTLQQKHIPFIYISANSNQKVLEAAKATHPYGFVVKPFRESDILTSIDIARYRYQQAVSFKNTGNIYLESFLNELKALNPPASQALLMTANVFQPYIPFDMMLACSHNQQSGETREYCISRTRFHDYRLQSAAEFITAGKAQLQNGETLHSKFPRLFIEGMLNAPSFQDLANAAPLFQQVAAGYQLKSCIAKTFQGDDKTQISLLFFSRIEQVYSQQHIDFINHFAGLTDQNVYKLLLGRESQTASPKPIPSAKEPEFEKLTGSSTPFLKVLDQVKVVAPTDTSVLITGESGTGKENIAFNIHRLSKRNNRPMIAINCGALPADLIESILFGHEKGAFTGATEARAGKFEEANLGTLFLDEIGEMPVNLQSKLLRVLQEKEVERLGASTPTLTDVRIIAATSRNLEKEVAAGRFRLDLYYRLHVFPITLPPLRERCDDIPQLAQYFMNQYAIQFGKQMSGISAGLMNQLLNYSWPGNIRELEHLMERSVLLSQSDILEENFLFNDDDELQVPAAPSTTTSGVKTIAENERDHIISILKQCNGRISGLGGAAELLGVPPTTLSSKMKKFGIPRL